MSSPCGRAPSLPHAVIRLAERVEAANAAEEGERLRAAIASGRLVIADLTGTAAIDMAGIGELALASKQARDHHAELRVVACAGSVLHALALTGVDAIVGVYLTVESAIAGPAHGTGASSRVFLGAPGEGAQSNTGSACS